MSFDRRPVRSDARGKNRTAPRRRDTGEVEVRGDVIGGIAVHTTVRIASLAGPGMSRGPEGIIGSLAQRID